jgi:hypothetical protein
MAATPLDAFGNPVTERDRKRVWIAGLEKHPQADAMGATGVMRSELRWMPRPAGHEEPSTP